ncbi:MAG TPA: SUMF1/EgtB/PvdO family nonheme iron enzyme, partial [Opitutales bacterium]|nr:SUMF1/EgtB/PvdO family nonheme iron enzyme [Opitutales bacterium]
NHLETLFVFPSLVGRDRAFPERFALHAKKLCALKHPNLLNFTHPLIIHNSYCLVGEAFECLSLPDHLMLLTGSQLSTTDNRQAVNLPPAQVTPILEQVLAGLSYAQECKVMHLNLNPTKILRGVRGEVKVYGYHFLAILGQELFEQLVSAGIPPLKLDPNRSFLGTTDILSPEARLRQTLEYRSDIYAIGVDTHWLLTGRKPISPYQPPSQLHPGIEPGWDAFAMRCLQRKPEERYATAAAALADLRNITHLTPVAQKQPLELLLAPEAPAPAADKKKAAKPPPPPKKKVKTPKGPRRARKPLTLAQRLLFIGLPSLLLVALATFIYVKIETSEDTAAAVPVRAQPGQSVRLLLNITPRIALVTIDKSTFNVSDGKLPISMPKGSYTITIESPPKYARSTLNYTTLNGEDTLYVKLVPAWAVVDFDTAPGATIEAQPANGPAITLGVADAAGKLRVTKNLGDDTYTFTASKENYSTAKVENQKIELTKTYHFDLKIAAEPATVTITTEPPGVTVSMGSHVLGQTPFTTTEIPVDTDVHLTLDKEGYKSVPRRLRVSPNVKVTMDLGSLTAQMGDLNVDFKLGGHPPTPEEARDAKIVIKQQAYPATTKHIGDMLEGQYAVTFEHPDYETVQQPVTIAFGQTATAAADLRPKPAHVAIHATPAVPIVVYLNNAPMASSSDGQYALPPGQKVKVRVQAQNFADAEKEFDLGPNQSAAWDVALVVLRPPVLGQDYTVPYLNLALKWIKPGQYTMGSPGNERNHLASEGPQTTVIIPQGFWAGADEVTQDQYQSIMGENPSDFGKNSPTRGRLPVENVSWLKAREFAQKLTERERTAKRLPEGYEYRLPTEAEWEYFARAGTTTPFSFGDHADPSNGNFKGNYPTGVGSATLSNDSAGTKPVGSYPPNPWGLYDVHGNVAEWVLDAYKSRLPGDTVTAPAMQAGDGNSQRLHRGGGWSDFARDNRSAWRERGERPEAASNAIGLRLVLAPAVTVKP